MSKAEWYESIVASLFTLEMGYMNGVSDEGVDRLGTSMLLHQSPLDQLLGDAVAGWNGRFFLVEFKRTADRVATEWQKPLRRQLLADLAHGYAAYRETDMNTRLRFMNTLNVEGDKLRGTWMFEHTLRAHFIGYGKGTPEGGLDIQMTPYAALLDPDSNTLGDRYELGEFFAALTSPTQSVIGVGKGEFIGYLARMLIGMSGSSDSDGTEVEESDSFIVLASATGYVPLPFRGSPALQWILSESKYISQAVEQLLKPPTQNRKGPSRG